MTQKYQMGTDDGHEVVWDINAIIKDLQNSNLPVCNRQVNDFTDGDNPCMNTEYAMSTNIETPCIIVELTDKTKKLIDGNHRLYKAKQLGIENLPCYILPLDYHKNFIVDYDASTYEKVALFYENILEGDF